MVMGHLTTDLLIPWLHTAVLVATFSSEKATELVRVMEGGVGQLLLVKVQSPIV